MTMRFAWLRVWRVIRFEEEAWEAWVEVVLLGDDIAERERERGEETTR
jgi:hypothetical protein